MAVAKPIPDYLRLFVESSAPAPPAAGGEDVTARLCRAFRRATGWSLTYHEGAPPTASVASGWTVGVKDQSSQTVGFLRLARSTSGKGAKAVDQVAARLLVEGIASTLTELTRAQRAVWQREAELAACVPVSSRRESGAELAARLESALKAGAEAIGCDAAGLYLLDNATTELKLRSAWGLDDARLLEPARPLAGQMADLEALLGHAVVLEDAALLPAWQPPEDFPAAVCVPVSTSAMSIGTLWAFCRRPRPFSDRDTNTLELTAGRIALELERQALLTQIQESTAAAQHMGALGVWQRHMQPACEHLVEHWETAGWCEQTAANGRVWCDWFLDDENRMLMVAGATQLHEFEATLAIQAARTAMRAAAAGPLPLLELCRRFQQTLWAVSHVDPQMSLWIGRLDANRRQMEFVAQGNVAAWLGHGPDMQTLAAGDPAPPTDQAWTPEVQTVTLVGTEVLMVTAAPTDSRVGQNVATLAEINKRMAALVRTSGRQSAARVADAMRALPDWRLTSGTSGDRVGLVLKGRCEAMGANFSG